jgi:glutaminyl-tRNA synthetase
VQSKDIEKDVLTKLYSMSLKKVNYTVRILAIENLELDVDNFDDHKKATY